MNTLNYRLAEILPFASAIAAVGLWLIIRAWILEGAVARRSGRPRVPTQRRRYTLLNTGQALLLLDSAWLFSRGSVIDIATATIEQFSRGTIGWLVGAGVIWIGLSPIMWAMAAIHVYRHPTAMAYKAFRKSGVYCTTESRRSGCPDMVVVSVTTDLSGQPQLGIAREA